MLNQALYNKADNYYTFSENWLNFTGTITGNAAIAENENSVAQFYAIPAYTNAPVLMVYNNDKTLMANSDNLVFDPAKQIPDGTLANSSAEFTPTGNAVVFNQANTTGSSINNFIPGDGTVTTLLANTTGDISLRSDGRIYISPYGSNALLAYEPDMASYTSLSSATMLTGTMANKVYKAQSAVITEQTYARLTGLKQYELKDHLGNVRSVVSDLLTATGTGSTPVNDARVLAYYNYYPFGMQMPGRYGPANVVGNGGYRYGFNGKEKDDDFGGSTSAVYDYGFRIYDSRIAKFLSVDPLTQKYPWYTPYQFAGNTPIAAIDLDGAEPKLITADHIGMKPAVEINNDLMVSYNQELKNSYLIRVPSSKSGEYLHIFDAHRASQDALAIAGVKSTKNMTSKQLEAAYKIYMSNKLKAYESLKKYDGLYYNGQARAIREEKEARDKAYNSASSGSKYDEISTLNIAGEVLDSYGGSLQRIGFVCLTIPFLEEAAPFFLVPGEAMSLSGSALQVYQAYKSGDNETMAKIVGIEAANYIFGKTTGSLIKGVKVKKIIETSGDVVSDEIKNKVVKENK